MPYSLFHYTSEDGLRGILETLTLRPSLITLNPADARYGDGQYFSNAVPGTLSSSQLSRAFLGFPFQGRRFTHFVEVDVTGLAVVSGRDGVFVVLNAVPLDLTGRILRSGSLPMKTQYVLIEWLHTTLDEPVRLYYELDSERYERRKVEEYRDGRLHSADGTHGQGNTFLAWEPHPPAAEIEKDPQFHVSEVTAQEFERIWQQVTSLTLEAAAT